jgi:hypothetical protein
LRPAEVRSGNFTKFFEELKMSKLIGLSVSFGIRDICEGKVKIEDVAYIVPGFTVVQTPEEIHKRYLRIYWEKYPNALEVLKQVKLIYISHLELLKCGIAFANNPWISEEEFNRKRFQAALEAVNKT